MTTKEDENNINKNEEVIVDLKGKNLSENSQNIFPKKISLTNITNLILSNNNFKTLPIEFTKLQNLKSLDISSNPIENLDEVITILKLLPNMSSLKIDLVSKDKVSLILSNFPNLISLNGQTIKNENNPLKDIDITEGEKDLYSFDKETDNYNTLLKEISKLPNYTKDFKKKFVKFLKEQIDNFNSNNCSSNYLYVLHLIQSKYEIYKYLFNVLIELGNNNNNNSNKFINLIRNIKTLSDRFISDLFKFIFSFNVKIENLLLYHEKNSNEYKHQINKLLDQININDNNAYISNKNINKKSINNINNIDRNNNQIKNEELNSNIKNHSLKKSNSSNNCTITKFPSNNYNTINSNPINKTINNNNYNTQNHLRNKNLNNTTNLTSYKKNTFYKVSNDTHYNNSNSTNKFNMNNNTNNISKNVYNKYNANVSINTKTLCPKNLSLSQLIQIINEIYQSKISHDKKCYNLGMPKETLEQHMYTYFNNKYGLKNITIEWAISLINGIKNYSLMNSEVCLFGKILRNELEEESYLVFVQLKKTIVNLLEIYYQNKFQYKSKKEIDELIEKKQNTFLEENEWVSLIKSLFPNEDENVLEKIYNFIFNNPKNFNYKNYCENFNMNCHSNCFCCGNGKKLTREDIKMMHKDERLNNISYYDFINILLEIQIRIRQKYLKNFIKIFRTFDDDTDGIINENQFKSLVHELDIFQNTEELDSYIESLLDRIDPFNTNVITFSDCVCLFSNEIIDDNNNVKIMDKIAMEKNNDNENNVENNNNINDKNNIENNENNLNSDENDSLINNNDNEVNDNNNNNEENINSNNEENAFDINYNIEEKKDNNDENYCANINENN